MRGGKRSGAGRKPVWNTSQYPLSYMRLPPALKQALLEARSEKIPVDQLIQILRQVA